MSQLSIVVRALRVAIAIASLTGSTACRQQVIAVAHARTNHHQVGRPPVRLLAPLPHSAHRISGLVFRWTDAHDGTWQLCDDFACEHIVDERHIHGDQFTLVENDERPIGRRVYYWRIKTRLGASPIWPILVGSTLRYPGIFLSKFSGGFAVRARSTGLDLCGFDPFQPSLYDDLVIERCTTDLCRNQWSDITIAGDLDNDGDDDIVAQYPVQSTTPFAAQILFHSDSFRLGVVRNTLRIEGVRRVRAVGDLNSDGHADLLALDRDGRVVCLYGPEFNGSRTVLHGLPPALSLEIQTPFDFNADGFTDAIIHLDNDAWILWGTARPPLAFSPLAPELARFSPARDLNQNGRDELVRLSFAADGNTIVELCETADGTFDGPDQRCQRFDLNCRGDAIVFRDRSTIDHFEASLVNTTTSNHYIVTRDGGYAQCSESLKGGNLESLRAGELHNATFFRRIGQGIVWPW